MVDTHTTAVPAADRPMDAEHQHHRSRRSLCDLHLQGFASELAAASGLKGLRAGLNQLAINTGRPDTEWWVHLTRRRLPEMTPAAVQRLVCAAVRRRLPRMHGRRRVAVRERPVVHCAAAGARGAWRGAESTFAAAPPPADVRQRQAAVPARRRLSCKSSMTWPRRSTRDCGCMALADSAWCPGAKPGVWFNQIDEAFHLILNNAYRRMPVSMGRCGRNIDPYEVEYGHRDWSVNTGSEYAHARHDLYVSQLSGAGKPGDVR